ncbi:MAG: hypothetical protein CL847_01775 [Crocinitomicaceae bacterium]|nr:hypothetical protein [Crocinitomicaceae bacterium]|tara:strand:+ start:7666 stop:8220 length:555 start_codon:yes stop_codon:yes gene_type:complete
MNKVILTVVGVWLIALSFLLLKPKPKFSSKSVAPIIAYVHGDSLHSGMNLITELEVTLQKNVEQVDSLLKTEAAPLQQEAQELVSYANSGSASEDEIQIAQQRVYEIEAILQQMQAEASKNVQLQEQTMQTTVSAFLNKVLSEYAEENNIDLILNWGLSGEGVLYGTEPYNVTAEVLEKLNSTE